MGKMAVFQIFAEIPTTPTFFRNISTKNKTKIVKKYSISGIL
jgi:hypothetical protein